MNSSRHAGLSETTQFIHEPDLQFGVLPVPSLDGILYLPLDKVIWMQADGSYTHIYSEDHPKQMLCRRLGEMERGLPANFFRCHRSYVINLRKVLKVYRVDGYRVELSAGIKLDVSKRNWKQLLQHIKDRSH